MGLIDWFGLRVCVCVWILFFDEEKIWPKPQMLYSRFPIVFALGGYARTICIGLPVSSSCFRVEE